MQAYTAKVRFLRGSGFDSWLWIIQTVYRCSAMANSKIGNQSGLGGTPDPGSIKRISFIGMNLGYGTLHGNINQEA